MSKIAIIGAGLSGLTIAFRLKQKGYDDIHLYEAKNRVGGRIHSILVRNLEGEISVGELGGQNIADGGDAKHIRSLIKECNLTLLENELELSRGYFLKGKLFDPYNLLKQQEFEPIALKKRLHEVAKNCNSIQDVLDNIFVEDSILKRVLTFQISAYEGSPAHLLSTYHNIETLKYGLLGGLSSAHKIDGARPTIHVASIKGGNAMLPLKLAEILRESIYLNKALERVEVSSNSQIALFFKNGQKTYCDKLILAIPCSVYKNIIFDHSIIPNTTLNFIKRVRYGTNAKILTAIKYKKNQYNAVFTDTTAIFFNEDRKLLNFYFAGNVGEKILNNFHKSYEDAMIAVRSNFKGSEFISGPPVIVKEEQLGYYTKPIVKSWTQDPYAQGSYSNFGIDLNNFFDDRTFYKGIELKTIFKPVDDRVFFIGEHASILEEIGTMEAAVESAERIVSII